MAFYYDSDEADQWEQEHDLKIIWKCPECKVYTYEAARYHNEALPCPDCRVDTINWGESYK